MSKENQSVEDLLKSLRSTIASKKKQNVENEGVVDLGEPIAQKPNMANKNEVIVELIKEIVEQKVMDILVKDEEMVNKALDKIVANSPMYDIINNAINRYFEVRPHYLESLVKEVIQRRLAKMMD